ncbi:MAG: hypothetical protein ABFD82_19930 [Syntrophaceae bacterium]
MKNTLLNIVQEFRENRSTRNKALIVSALAVFTILIIPNLIWKQSTQKDLATLTAKYSEFTALTGNYKSLKENVSTIEQKKSLTKINSVAQAMEDITAPLGIKAKMKSIKGTGTKKVMDQMTEDSAEVQMEKLNMTELIHMMYKIDNAPLILAVKKMVIKKSFESAEHLDVTLSMSVFSGASIR